MANGFSNISPDINIMDAEDMDELFFTAYEQALGEETSARMQTQVDNYEYYDGRQHRDEDGNLVDASELERPVELDYKPTRYATNYFKSFVDRKARWQMSGSHSIHIPREQIDDPLDRIEETYEPSSEQQKENERAEQYEKLLQQLWRENKMQSKLLQVARDRLIADRVPCKIIYNPNTGKLRWIWRPDYEFIPIYSDDDFEDMIGCYFITSRKEVVNGEEVDAIKLQAYTMHEGEAYIHESIYDTEDLKMIKELTPSKESDYEGIAVKIEDKMFVSLGLDFIPVVMVPVEELTASRIGDGEISDLREQNDVINQMNEDAIDSLKFEMFPLTAVLNAPPGTAEKMDISPGAVIEARSSDDSKIPEILKVESGFRWKEAFKDQYARVKGAMHEISGLPQIDPQELQFGGINSEALRVIFHDIIADTEEHWLTWQYALQELHEKSVKYLQSRVGEGNFSYDKDVVRSIEDYHNEIKFQLPLPDNRKELVELLSSELSQDLESQKGAMERLGVDNVFAKKKEISSEKLEEMMQQDPYGIDGGDIPDGELEVLCDRCGGSGRIISDKTNNEVTCPKCAGSGWYQPRKR